MEKEFDVFVIGGGINGVGIARDAAGRGYATCLVEMDDLASGTSSWSSKLIHGGLRYLEHYEFNLVRKALSEREVLLKSAPHIIWPMRFVLPHHKGLRPAWLLRLGLFLYDHIGARKLLPGTSTVNLSSSEVGKPLKDDFKKGFEYSDCWVNDARLVVLNATDARERGAEIKTRTQFVSAQRQGNHWKVQIKNLNTGESETCKARLLVNAAGPWVDDVMAKGLGHNNPKNVRLVQGSHIVVPKLHNHDRAYIFQNADNRIIFALPYEQDFTLIGTTDRDYEGEPRDVAITPEEIDYLCDAASEYFKKPVKKETIVWTYAGVRSLYDDGATAAQEATRDYILRIDGDEDQPKVINIFGGKITTYRRLAENMLRKVEKILGARKPSWTADSHLSGGDFEVEAFDDLVLGITQKHDFIEQPLAWRYARAYGTLTWKLLENIKNQEDMGKDFGSSLYAVEVIYLMQNEWAQTAEDIVWRRTKLGIRMSDKEISTLDDWMKEQQIDS